MEIAFGRVPDETGRAGAVEAVVNFLASMQSPGFDGEALPFTAAFLSKSSQVKSIQKQQTTIRKPIECAPEASSGGRESMEMAEGDP